MLRRSWIGFGEIALAGMLAEQAVASGGPTVLQPRQPHSAPQAKRVVLLFLTGGPSHVDLWDWNFHYAILTQED